MFIPIPRVRLRRIATVLLIASLTPLMHAFPPASVKSPVAIDFSYAGYEAGREVPSIKAVLMVRPSGGDDTALIQGALDRVAARPIGADGFRGTLFLTSGQYRVTDRKS